MSVDALNRKWLQRSAYGFSAKGARCTDSLGQRPRIHAITKTPALKAPFTSRDRLIRTALIFHERDVWLENDPRRLKRAFSACLSGTIGFPGAMPQALA